MAGRVFTVTACTPCMRCKDQLVQKKTQKKHNTKIEIEIHHETQKGKKNKNKKQKSQKGS